MATHGHQDMPSQTTVLAVGDEDAAFVTRASHMIAHVPTRAAVRTVYARFGDLLAWACVAVVVVGVGMRLMPGMR